MGTSTFCSSSKWNWDDGLQNKDANYTAFTPEDRRKLQRALRWELGLLVTKTLLRTQHFQVCSQRCASFSERPAEKIWRWVHLNAQWFLYPSFNKCLFNFFLSVWRSFPKTLVCMLFICGNLGVYTEDAFLQELSLPLSPAQDSWPR